MIEKYNNIGIFSDVHLWHKNIHKYEEEKRKKIDDFFWLKYSYDNTWYWQDFTKKFLKYIKEEQKKNNLLYYINLWDFLFHPSKEKIKELWENNINKLLENNIFILWNHDLKNKKDYNIIDFNNVGEIDLSYINQFKTDFIENIITYSAWFKVFHLIEEKEKKTLNIFTHYPVYSTLTEKYYTPNLFKRIDQYLINLIEKQYKNYYVVNYYGHTHSSENEFKNNKVKYINCCIDYNI